MNSWIIIPARGGSKTIPGKNLALLNGLPLIDYVLRVAEAYGKSDRIIVSTEDDEIAEHAKSMGAVIAGRPFHLTGDAIPVSAVIGDLLEQDKAWPDIIILLQPTSPFVLKDHIGTAMGAFRFEGDSVNSFETITELPHNHHEWNQREITYNKDRSIIKERVFWVHPEERRLHYNKQTKPKRYVFGNLVAFRPERFCGVSNRNLFEYPRRYAIIPRAYAHDVDDEFDLAMAGFMIEKGLVKLEHMK